MSFHSVFLIAGILTIAGTLVSLRRERIRPEYSVSWLAMGAVLTGMALFPGLVNRFSAVFGLEPPTFFLILSGALISALVFEISRVVSRLRDENVLLAQKIAVLEFRIDGLPQEDGFKKTQ